MSESQEKGNKEYSNMYQSYPYYYYPQYSPAYYPYDNRQFSHQPTPNQQSPETGANVAGMLPIQESYIENILRLNRGKKATFYLTFGNNEEKKFTGVIEAAGRDHIIISDTTTGKRYLLLMVYLDYVVFDEAINYSYPSIPGQMSSYSPR